MPNARTAKSTREKAAALRIEADRKAARQRAVIAGIAVLAVLLIVVGGTIAVRSLQAREQAKESAAPANIVDDGVVSGNAASTVALEIYLDFQCPACKSFEEAAAPLIDEYAKGGKVKVVHRPVAILDWASSTGYSTRALNTVAAVLNSSPSSYPALHKALFDNQPPENTAGLTDAQLLDLAVAAGAPKDAVEKAQKEMTYKGWTKKVSNGLSKRFPPGGTPTVVLNGKQVENPSPENLKAAVDAAIAG